MSIKEYTKTIAAASFTRPANTTQYTALDSINAVTTPIALDFTNLIQKESTAFKLTDVIITSSNPAATLLQANLWLFNTDPTPTADNSAMSLTDAENLTVEAVVPVTVGYKTDSNSRIEAHNLNYIINQTASTKTIFGLLQAVNAYTPASGEVFQVTLKGEQLI